MLDFGQLSERFHNQIGRRTHKVHAAMMSLVAVSFRMKGPGVQLPAFAPVNDVLVVTQVQSWNKDISQRGPSNMDTFTATVAVENGTVLFGDALVDFRNLALHPSYNHGTKAAFTGADKPALREALDMDSVRLLSYEARVAGKYIPSSVALPQLLAGYTSPPHGALDVVPIPPGTSKSPYWLIPFEAVSAAWGPPDALYLDMRAWQSREVEFNFAACLPTVPNPFLAACRSCLPSMDVRGVSLYTLPQEQQEKLVAMVDQEHEGMPDAMLQAAACDMAAMVHIVPPYGISTGVALAECRRQLGAYSEAATDSDILANLQTGDAWSTFSKAPMIRAFYSTEKSYSTTVGYKFKFDWPVDRPVAPAANTDRRHNQSRPQNQHQQRQKSHPQRADQRPATQPVVQVQQPAAEATPTPMSPANQQEKPKGKKSLWQKRRDRKKRQRAALNAAAPSKFEGVANEISQPAPSPVESGAEALVPCDSSAELAVGSPG